MGRPSMAKPSCKNSSLRPSSRGRRKLNRKRNPNPSSQSNAKLKLSRNRNKQQRLGSTSRPQDHSTYHPPRLQDLQFQNRLKAFRHFENVYNASNGAYPHMLDGSVPLASGFLASTLNTSGAFLTDARLGGILRAGLDFPTQGSAYTASFAYTGNGLSFPLPNPRIINLQRKSAPSPGALLYAGENAGRLPGVANSLEAFIVGSNTGGDASTSGADSAFPKQSGKGNGSFKRHKARPHRTAIGALKMRGAPAAPRNTTSFLMRAKKAGGIASFVSPSPDTPAVIPTPVISPFATFNGLADEANHNWGVDDYGSMNGLIRLRSIDRGVLEYGDNNDSESEVDEAAQSVQQLDQRLDQDVSRFVMTYPANRPLDMGHATINFSRLDDEESHIAHLEEENLDLKERLYSMQQEVDDLRRRLHVLEGFTSGDDAEAEASCERDVASETRF